MRAAAGVTLDKRADQDGRLQVTKLVEYFPSDVKMSAHQAMDQRFGFGLNWKRGSKD